MLIELFIIMPLSMLVGMVLGMAIRYLDKHMQVINILSEIISIVFANDSTTDERKVALIKSTLLKEDMRDLVPYEEGTLMFNYMRKKKGDKNNEQ